MVGWGQGVAGGLDVDASPQTRDGVTRRWNGWRAVTWQDQMGDSHTAVKVAQCGGRGRFKKRKI